MKRRVPLYVERAVLKLAEDEAMARKVTKLLPYASAFAAASLSNAHLERMAKWSRVSTYLEKRSKR